MLIARKYGHIRLSWLVSYIKTTKQAKVIFPPLKFYCSCWLPLGCMDVFGCTIRSMPWQAPLKLPLNVIPFFWRLARQVFSSFTNRTNFSWRFRLFPASFSTCKFSVEKPFKYWLLNIWKKPTPYVYINDQITLFYWRIWYFFKTINCFNTISLEVMLNFLIFEKMFSKRIETNGTEN